MASTEVQAAATKIWEYMHMGHELIKADAVFLLCSNDEKVGEYAAQLILDGYSDLLLISGGPVAKNLKLAEWPEDTEAEHFASIAKEMGVSDESIILERKATNTGENVLFMQKLLEEKGVELNSVILVQKPYAERRSYATFVKQWKGEPQVVSMSPYEPFSDYYENDEDREKAIHTMVGDLQRVKEYPAMGFQIEQEIPQDVWQAQQFLVAQGYTGYLIKE